jgi:hypothetical protein
LHNKEEHQSHQTIDRVHEKIQRDGFRFCFLYAKPWENENKKNDTYGLTVGKRTVGTVASAQQNFPCFTLKTAYFLSLFLPLIIVDSILPSFLCL